MICDNCCAPSKCLIYHENANICIECSTMVREAREANEAHEACQVCGMNCGNTCLDIFTRSLQIF